MTDGDVVDVELEHGAQPLRRESLELPGDLGRNRARELPRSATSPPRTVIAERHALKPWGRMPILGAKPLDRLRRNLAGRREPLPAPLTERSGESVDLANGRRRHGHIEAGTRYASAASLRRI